MLGGTVGHEIMGPFEISHHRIDTNMRSHSTQQGLAATATVTIKIIRQSLRLGIDLMRVLLALHYEPVKCCMTTVRIMILKIKILSEKPIL